MHISSIALLLPFSNESTGPTSFLFFSFCTHKYRGFFFCSLFAVYVYKRITRTCLELSSALRGGKREEGREMARGSLTWACTTHKKRERGGADRLGSSSPEDGGQCDMGAEAGPDWLSFVRWAVPGAKIGGVFSSCVSCVNQ